MVTEKNDRQKTSDQNKKNPPSQQFKTEDETKPIRLNYLGFYRQPVFSERQTHQLIHYE
jgi:hypothetical protein